MLKKCTIIGIRIYRGMRAILSGKITFYVPTLGRVCFASSEKQCKRKFIPHKVERISILQYVLKICLMP